jgi:predicted nucleotidyltransferase
MNETERYGIPEADLEKLIYVLQKNPKIETAVLFGSRAKGNFEPGSDIDIALKGNNLNLKDILNAKIEIEKLYLPWKTDLIIYQRIKEDALIEHIKRMGIKLF